MLKFLNNFLIYTSYFLYVCACWSVIALHVLIYLPPPNRPEKRLLASLCLALRLTVEQPTTCLRNYTVYYLSSAFTFTSKLIVTYGLCLLHDGFNQLPRHSLLILVKIFLPEGECCY
jgi:hypothetical protein